MSAKSGDLEAVFCASDLDPVGRNFSQDLTWRLLLASFSQGQCQVTCLNYEQLKFGTESFSLSVIFCTFIKRSDIFTCSLDFHLSHAENIDQGSFP